MPTPLPPGAPVPPSSPDAPPLDLSQVTLDDLPVAQEPGMWDHYLMNAVHENSPERVVRALTQGANPNVPHPGQGLNALHLAAQEARAWAIPLLLAAGADVERPALFQCATRPLGLAVNIKLPVDQILPCVTALLAAGADPNAEDNEGHSPFRMIVGRYQEPSSRCDELLRVVDRFLEHGAGRPDGEGNTPFHWFLINGHPRVAQHLLDRGLPWAGNRYGETALDVLSHNDRPFGSPSRNDPIEKSHHDRACAVRYVFETFLLRRALNELPDGLESSSPPPSSPVRTGRPRL